MDDAHAREVEDVLSSLETDVHSGLSDFEVSKVRAAAPASCCWMVDLLAVAAAADFLAAAAAVTCCALPPAGTHTLWQQRAAT
jgi:hypothetical protein